MAASAQSAPVAFRSLVFLGTSSGTPTTYRNVSSYALNLSDGAVWLVDAGEGTQQQLMKCAHVSRGSIERIFVTHLHGDHSFGLPGLMCSMSLTWSAPGVTTKPGQQLQQPSGVEEGDCEEHGDDGAAADLPRAAYDHFSKKTQFLELYGPQGLASYLRGALISSESRFPFQYRVTELMHSCSPRAAAAAPSADYVSHTPSLFQQFTDSVSALRHPDEADPVFLHPVEGQSFHYNLGVHRSLSVRAAVLNHRVFCVGYVVTEADAPGTLLMEKVNALGIPKGPLLSKLKMGTAVTFSRKGAKGGGGKVEGDAEAEVVTVQPADVVGPPHRGRTAVLLGDTCNSANISSLLSSSSSEGCRRGVDWLVHESTFDAANEALAIPRGHSTARMAGMFAASIRARNLILTHFSARFPSSAKDPDLLESIRKEAEVAAEAAAVAMAATVGDAADGGRSVAVHIADDFSVFDMERKKVVPAPPTARAAAVAAAA